MYPKLAIISSALLFLLLPPAQGQPAESIFPYTLQVASFPDATLAQQYAEHLSRAGEPVGVGTFELPGRGNWTRVYVGSFKTTSEARDYGNALINRKLIAEYIVKTASELQSLGRPHTVKRTLRASDSPAPQAANGHAAPGDLSKNLASRQTVNSVANVSLNKLTNSAKPRPAILIAPP